MKSCLRPTDKKDEFFSFVAVVSVGFFYRFLVSLDLLLRFVSRQNEEMFYYKQDISTSLRCAQYDSKRFSFRCAKYFWNIFFAIIKNNSSFIRKRSDLLFMSVVKSRKKLNVGWEDSLAKRFAIRRIKLFSWFSSSGKSV